MFTNFEEKKENFNKTKNKFTRPEKLQIKGKAQNLLIKLIELNIYWIGVMWMPLLRVEHEKCVLLPCKK